MVRIQNLTSFFYTILMLCAAYTIFEWVNLPHLVLAVDEFVFARHIYDYTHAIPYLDFPPYKGVLGYYLLSIPLFFSHGLLEPLFNIKKEIVLLNAFFIFVSAYWALQIFNKRAVILALLAVMANQYFLLYAADLRVDMLTVWFCLFAIFSVVQNKLRLGGVLIGLAFLISQKAIWYWAALNGTLILCGLFFSIPLYFRRWLQFNLSAIAVVVGYILIWSAISSPALVLHNLFYDAYVQAGIEGYLGIYPICWALALQHGPLLFLAWPLTFLMFLEKNNSIDMQKKVFIISCASIALLFFVTYKQPFPYNFVFTIPAYFILAAEFISWLLAKKATLMPSRFIMTLLIAYSLIILALIIYIPLPILNYLLVPLPILLYLACRHGTVSPALASIFILSGLLYPFYLSGSAMHHLNGSYQQSMIKVTHDLIANDGSYVAGIPYLYQSDQPIAGLKNLISPELEYIYKPSETMKSLLLPSLYLAPTTPSQIIHDFEMHAVKVVVFNYRIYYLPDPIKNYILDHYQHYYGSVFLYAPKINAAQLSFNLKFSANYRVLTQKPVRIDGKKIHNGKIIYLSKGDHMTAARKNYRLILIPKLKELPDPRFQQAQHEKMINPIIA